MRTAFGLAACLLVLSACDASDPNPAPELPSSFEASVTGDETLALTGPSWVLPGLLVNDPNDPESELQTPLQIGMTDFSGLGVSSGILTFMIDGPAEVGTVDLAPQEDSFFRPRATLTLGEPRSGLYADAVSGTLTITRADSAAVAGAFRFVTREAREGYVGLGDPAGSLRPFAVTVEGSFEATFLQPSDRPHDGWPYSVVVPRPLP